MIDIPEAIQAKACDAVRELMHAPDATDALVRDRMKQQLRIEDTQIATWFERDRANGLNAVYEMALRWAISETAREALGEQLTELQNDAVPRMWLAQTANVLNLYFHGYVPKDVAGPLLEKIKQDWPGLLDPIQEPAPCLAGDYDL